MESTYARAAPKVTFLADGGGPDTLRTDRPLAPSDFLKRPFHEHNLEASWDIGFLDRPRLTVSPVSPVDRNRRHSLFSSLRYVPHLMPL